jgi:hypothetical protein
MEKPGGHADRPPEIIELEAMKPGEELDSWPLNCPGFLVSELIPAEFISWFPGFVLNLSPS